MKKLFFLLVLLCLPFISGSHVGSPGVTFEGKAGKYSVLVLITPPDVIPGTATVDIYTSTQGIESVFAKPVYWFAGGKGAPSADQMLPVEGEPGHYRGIIWLMSAGTSGIELEISGGEGNGSVIVPVMAVSTAQKEMPASLGWALFGLCIFLVILMITIVSASVSDGLIKPNSDVDQKTISRKRWTAAAVSAVVLILILWGGQTWWNSWSSNYQRFLYKRLTASSFVSTQGKTSILTFRIDTVRLPTLFNTRRLSLMVPDHGKLMHMFLVRAGSMDVFAHLHPQRKDSTTFVTPVPDLPGGKYLIFADFTRWTGFAETIADTIEIENKKLVSLVSNDSVLLGRDDTYFITNPIAQSPPPDAIEKDIVTCGSPGVKTTLQDGSTAIWEYEANKPFIKGKLYDLTFAIQDELGQAAKLKPYLGMMGHAVVMKDDGSVYIHLHPVGNYSMASQQTIVTRFKNESGPMDWTKLKKSTVFMDSVDRVVSTLDAMTEEERNVILTANMDHSLTDPDHPDHSIVKFPYSFPSAGKYRIWIQMKRNGKILNSAFDALVED
jgi:hypothetical protein